MYLVLPAAYDESDVAMLDRTRILDDEARANQRAKALAEEERRPYIVAKVSAVASYGRLGGTHADGGL